MSIRSMTGFAQVKSQAGEGTSFTLSLKSVNHRFLDPQLRMPVEMDELEMKIRRVLKERLARGHIDVTLAVERRGGAAMNSIANWWAATLRRSARHARIRHTRRARPQQCIPHARRPGRRDAACDGNFETSVLAALEQAIQKLNHMREQEGRGMEAELRRAPDSLEKATNEVDKLRAAVSKAYMEKVRSRMQELMENADEDRMLQEAAILAERSDIQEELVRLNTHIDHFRKLLDQGGEVGKKLDFLLQELNREANTLLSKTSGVAGEGLRITELGLLMKSEIEKCREQVQNLE